MKRFQVGGGNLTDRFFRAERVQPVAGVAEQSAPHRDTGADQAPEPGRRRERKIDRAIEETEAQRGRADREQRLNHR